MDHRTVTENQIKILQLLMAHAPVAVGAGTIGNLLRGKSSRWASPILLRMVETGLVWRDGLGQYRISHLGISVLDDHEAYLLKRRLRVRAAGGP